MQLYEELWAIYNTGLAKTYNCMENWFVLFLHYFLTQTDVNMAVNKTDI